MRTMKVRILLFSIAASVLFLAVGCSSGNDKAGQNTVSGDYSAEPGKKAAGEAPTK